MARIPITASLSIDEDDLTFRFVLASGPGGQNVNKVSTAVELRFDSTKLEEPSSGFLRRLQTEAGQRMTQDGVIVIFAQTHRSQIRNKEEALARLVALLAKAAEVQRKRRPTRPTLGSQKRRLDGKALRSGVKRMRGKPLDG
ncbi:aminoacyl-tRNA hydrolase [Acidisoma cellulosilytica]|uniref:Aminoacyl-tRNA hydrolase n=1 Tax=Acidisoma cellulosilyticum TaxID=2802395 RepID=A0A963Z1P5_9PROT|nr:alternative ribosome rescue aminoacyl-tRNA hydrolase ArfB [Acidisoma cellulosilyticum]MCB8880377.1 aminoacyl-tRNA hydrolase [Acidisoma cellulosilyticum]